MLGILLYWVSNGEQNCFKTYWFENAPMIKGLGRYESAIKWLNVYLNNFRSIQMLEGDIICFRGKDTGLEGF